MEGRHVKVGERTSRGGTRHLPHSEGVGPLTYHTREGVGPVTDHTWEGVGRLTYHTWEGVEPVTYHTRETEPLP